MAFLEKLLLKIGLIFAAVFGIKKWGKAEADRDRLKEVVEERHEDAEIASKPFVSRPLSKLRFRKKRMP